MSDEEATKSREAFLNFTPPPLGDYDGPTPKGQPMNFFDTHLDQQLVLKHVRRLPSLPADLAKAVDDFLMPLPVTTFPPHAYTIYPNSKCYKDRDKLLDADDVFVRFQSGIADICGRIATGLMLHSEPCFGTPAFRWYDEPSLNLNRDRYPDKYMGFDYALCTSPLSEIEGLLDSYVDPGDRARVLRLEKEKPFLAVGMFFASNGKLSLWDMHHKICRSALKVDDE